MARLTLPLRFRTEEYANGCIEASSLFPIGAKAVRDDCGRWLVVIDTDKPERKVKFLKQQMPGIEWQVSE
jgi:hypothetical protein